MSTILDEVKGLVWTLAGTGLVLITLSGSTLKWGIWISVAGLVIHLTATALSAGEKDESGPDA